MVVLAAAVCTNTGRTILSRQFVEMTRMHIEALLAAFPKLMNTGKQHTFVETDSVRYVYQPLGKLYMVLLTTKNSNILEDLETLGLFSRVIPKYCAVLEESEIAGHCFDLLFAFDEIVALGGYRENVSLAQVLAFTEMDSQEEKVFLAIRETQEREATAERAKKARELEQARRDANRKKMSGFSGGGRVTSVSSASIIEDIIVKPERPKMTPFRPSGWGTSKALKLHPRGKEVDSFVDKLKSEGETVMPAAGRRGSGTTKVLPPPVNAESVHLCAKETISLTCCRDGGLQNMEVLGKLTLRVTEGKSQRVRLVVANDSTGFELKANPQMDEKLFKAESVISLKNPENSFPLNQDVLVLKWRLQTADKSLVPLTINCWPSESVSGCDVIIDYELQQERLELNDVFISIPVPPGVGAPVIGDLDDGECEHDKRLDVLVWSLPAIDANNKSGSLEFSVDGHPDDFFPINVSFVSKRNYCNIQVTEVNHVDGDAPVRFSSETSFVVDKYEIL